MRDEQQKLVDIELKKIELRTHLITSLTTKMFFFLFATIMAWIAVFYSQGYLSPHHFFYGIASIVGVFSVIAMYSLFSVKKVEAEIDGLKKKLRIEDE